jgi:murein DD-endopeptidase MepM/ murein hydrolase activator NlpD
MLATIAAVPSSSADNLKHKKHKVQHHLKVVHSDLDESSAQLRQATAALGDAQARLGKAQDHLATTRGQLAAAAALDRQMQARLDAAVTRLQAARAELSNGQDKVAGEERELGQIVVQNYQTGSPALMGLSMVLTSQDPAELTGQLNSVQNVMDKQGVVLDRLEASKVLLTVQEQQVAAAKVEVAKQRQVAAENLARKKKLEAQAESAAEQVHNLVTLRAVARNEAAKARAADLAELHNLQQERNRIATILRKRAEEARRRAEAAAAAADGAEGPIHSNGFLDWPASGPVTSPFGWRIHPIYGYRSLHDGIDIAIPCGTPLHAPASGTVLEEYFNAAWGNRIILDLGFHDGVGLAVILNHLSSYVARQGDHVKRGEIVGYSGTTGWSTGCHTHFTVLVNGSAVNPMKWL